MSETNSGGGVPPIVNRAMKLVLRSPLHGAVSKTILLLTFTGRKSGTTYTTPVSYSEQDGQISIFTHAAWWKNLSNGRPVTIHIRGQERQGLVELVVDDKHTISAGLMAHLRQVPFDARFYGVTLDGQRSPNAEEVEKAAQTVVMIRIRPC
jgi:deazaflavin-dependent oxidoreductase (nitroreductase family)